MTYLAATYTSTKGTHPRGCATVAQEKWRFLMTTFTLSCESQGPRCPWVFIRRDN